MSLGSLGSVVSHGRERGERFWECSFLFFVVLRLEEGVDLDRGPPEDIHVSFVHRDEVTNDLKRSDRTDIRVVMALYRAGQRELPGN